MRAKLFTGAATALITPFDEHGVDVKALKKIIAYQLQNNISALVVLGTTGEASTMTDSEKRMVIETARELCPSNIPLIVGVGSNDTERAKHNAAMAQNSGADGLLIVTPFYNKATPEGLYRHFSEICSVTSLPSILYNVPSRTGVNLDTETAIRVAKNCNICGLKEASGNISQTLDLLSKTNLIPVYCGDDGLTVPFLSIGADGVISVASNAYPDIIVKMCDAFFSGDTELAKKIQVSIQPLVKLLFAEVNPIPVKYVMSKLNYCQNRLRLPLTAASKQLCEKLDKLINDENYFSFA